MSTLWQDEGAWIALGISALFLLVAFVMHRAFVKVLKSGASDAPANSGTQDE